MGIHKYVVLQEAWIPFLVDNYMIIKNWIQYNKIQFLQMINPGVPGIINKLDDERNNVRHLERVRDLWNAHIEVSNKEIVDIYSGNKLESTFDVDHFIPWSYVAHDEMWNLNPTTKSINSSKSNNLPDWDTYFKKLAQQEYHSYQLMWKNDIVHKEFEKCAKEHINSDDIRYRVYRRGLEYPVFAEELKSIILPVYQSAQNCGFGRGEY